MANVALILFMVFTIILLFVAMVFSAMAATDAKKGADTCKKNCNKYSMWAALVAGLSVALIFVSLIIYIYVSSKGSKEANAISVPMPPHYGKLGSLKADPKFLPDLSSK